MGTWGAGLYADDTCCDVRDDYVQGLKSGLSDEETYRYVLKRHSCVLDDPNFSYMVYFPLADTAWKYGRLNDELRSIALVLLKQLEDCSSWGNGAKARKKVQQTLEVKLLSPQPERRLVKFVPVKPRKIRTTADIGSVFLIDLPSGNKAALVLVGFLELEKSIDPVFSALCWQGTVAPTKEELEQWGQKTVIFDSGLGSRPHIGILPRDERKSIMADLQLLENLSFPGLAYSPQSITFKSVRRIAEEIQAFISKLA